jgi:hypothetical protein
MEKLKMRIDESRALLQECFSLSQQKFGVDFFDLDEQKQGEIIDEAERKVLVS